MMAPSLSRIVIRGVNWLGDAVISIPALVRLRAAYPGAHIAMLAPQKLADLWAGQPSLDEIIPFTSRDGVGGVSRRLRTGSFDAAVIFPNSFRSAFEPWLAGIPRRIGYEGAGRNVFLTRAVHRRPGEIPMRKRTESEVKRLIKEDPSRPREVFPVSGHHLHHYLHLVGEMGANREPLAPKLEVTQSERESFRGRFGIAAERVIGLNPGAEYGPAKRWPLDRFIAVAHRLNSTLDPGWLIFGGPADIGTAAELEQGIKSASPQARVHNVAGKTNLRELCAGLSLCDVVLTNDTGPMHLAAAIGARVVVPFGSTSPELTGPGWPGDTRHQLISGKAPCAPCFLRSCPIDFRCMKSITVEQTAAALAAACGARETARRE